MKECGCEECSCHYPLETFLGQVNSAGASLPLKDALVVCGRCKKNLSCRECRGDDE